MDAEIDLVINTFERTYRNVLAPGTFRRVEEQNLRRFRRRVALINNVGDLDDARRRAASLRDSGEIDEYHVVEDRLDKALAATGLTRRDLGRIPHYSDCALVAVTLPGAPWLLYWDAEVELDRPYDWISPSVDLMEADERVVGASPTGSTGEARWSTLEVVGDFALSFGLSDQLFLARRKDLGRPIYGCSALASLRFPLAHVAPVFEQRLDAYMRSVNRYRASHLCAIYHHPKNQGFQHPRATAPEKLRRVRNHLIFRILGFSKVRHRKLVVNCRPRTAGERARLARWEELWRAACAPAGGES